MQSLTERSESVKNFQSSDDNKIIIAIPAAGGVGLTLTRASTAIYLDRSWNGEHWLQSIDRIHRIGQMASVNIISLVAGGVDRLIAKNLMKKESFLRDFMDNPERLIRLEKQHQPTLNELIEALH
jgi:SWI/SNF-related matrix-associated actin-dependent regulator 1 of chromatin subfamily A